MKIVLMRARCNPISQSDRISEVTLCEPSLARSVLSALPPGCPLV